MNCESCKNLIDINGGLVSCEAHTGYNRRKKSCDGYLDLECENKDIIIQNRRNVTKMHLEDMEDKI